MRENIYYDWHRNRALNECHGCPYDQWTEMSDCSFAVHPKGFLVFLRPSQIAALDVACVDPTSVRRSANVAYHRRRFGVTLELLRRAGLAEKSAPKVLDVGCGGADITAEIHKAFPNAEIFALDCSIRAIECAVQTHPGIEYSLGDAYDLPYVEGCFDAVVCNNMWEHVPDPMRFLEGVRKVMKPCGHLVLSTPSRYRMSNLVRVLRGKPVGLMSPKHVTEYTVGQVVEQLRFGGFRIQHVDGRPLRAGGGGLRGFVKAWLLTPPVELFLKMVGSHHSLASTVFFLATKTSV
ncbi:MAG: class I SAM-dependent methyltransferase [Phycisphaerae bacterium]